MPDNRIVAIGLLTEDDLSRLGETFTRLWPVEDASGFEDLLKAIDEADAQLAGGQEEPAGEPARTISSSGLSGGAIRD